MSFCRAYMRGIDAAKASGELRQEIDSEVLAYTLMGASNFLGLNWGLFQDYPTDVERVVESFMHIIEGGIFAKTDAVAPPPAPPAIRIQVEFDDDDLDDEGEEAPAAGEEAPED